MDKVSLKLKRLSLARLLKMYSEVITDENVTLITEGDLAIGSEVFIADEEGNLVPAVDGEYHSGDITYVVESGVIVAMETKAEEEPKQEEDTPEEREEMSAEVEEKEEKEEVALADIDANVAEELLDDVAGVVEDTAAVAEEMPQETEDEKDVLIAELKAKIAELEAIVAEYHEREQRPVSASIDEEDKKSNVKMSAEDERIEGGKNLLRYLRELNEK